MWFYLAFFGFNFKCLCTGKSAKLAFRIPDGFELSIFADSEKVGNPVSIAIDSQNRIYVAEVQRFRRGVEDSRQHNLWFLDELKINSLQGRLDLYDKWTKKGRFKPGHFTEYSDIITVLEDTSGDGHGTEVVLMPGDLTSPSPVMQVVFFLIRKV